MKPTLFENTPTTQLDSQIPAAEGHSSLDAPIQHAVEQTVLGLVLVAATDKGLRAILFGGSRAALIADLRSRFPGAALMPGDASHEALTKTVARFIDDPTIALAAPLDPSGTPFQKRVWAALREVPAGATVSYSDIARTLGLPKGAKEVAEACAANPLAVVVPCHRVVRKDGVISGYRWGVWRKRSLLDREKAVESRRPRQARVGDRTPTLFEV